MCFACQITARMDGVELCLHPASSEWAWTELAVLRERYALAEHPYLIAVRRGSLPRSELPLLATEHDQVVTATAAAVRRLAFRSAADLEDVIEVCEQAIDAWRAFAAATGWVGTHACFYGEDPFPETVALAQCIVGRDPMTVGEACARLYALRVAQLDVAPSLSRALAEHHAIDGDQAAWFRASASGDALAAALRSAVADALVDDPLAVLAAARETLEALWRFYDRLDTCRAHATS